MKSKYLATAVSLAAVAVAYGDILDMDRENGIKVGQRMTLKPYVSFSYTYDSNVDSGRHSKAGSQWSVNPGLELVYLGDNWTVDGSVWYTYHAYNRYSSQLDSSSFGEQLGFNWENSRPDEPGWRFMFRERFEQIAQDDDMSNHGGRGIGRDRKQLNVEGVLERRLSERIHAAANASYYLLDYKNDVDKYASLYGWKRAHAGGEVGYMASNYLDLLLAANYQWYWQDNNKNRDYYRRDDASRRGRRVASDSKGWTVMAGVGTRATEKLSYKLMGGWSRFEYGSGTKDIDGWTYQVSGDWQVDDDNTFHIMALGASYYQPSEREYGSAIKVYSMGLGAGKGFVRNTLKGTLDFNYRRETHEYTEYSMDDYDLDYWTFRVGLNYRIHRMLAVFGRVEYQFCDSQGRNSYLNEYDRWRATVGFSLTY